METVERDANGTEFVVLHEQPAGAFDRAGLLFERARRAGFPFAPFAGSGHLAGEASWRGVHGMLAGHLDDVERALAAHESQLRTAREIHARDAERDADRQRERTPLRDDDPEAREVAAMIEESAAIAKRDAGPATYAQTAEMVKLLRDVLDELRRR